MTENLIGYKSRSIIETGYIFCPYVPLVQTPVVTYLREPHPEQDEPLTVPPDNYFNWKEDGF